MCSAIGESPRSEKAVKRESSAACKGFPLKGQRLIRRVAAKAKEARRSVRSELDRRYDETLAKVTGRGGTLTIGKDERGQAIVTNFPATLPGLFRNFCALHAANEAIVAGDERLSFAELDAISECTAHGLAARGIGQGNRVAIAMRNCPSWVVSYMAILKAGAVATLINGWWEAHEIEHALNLTDPKLVIADASRARRIEARCPGRRILTVAVEQPVES